MDETELTLAMKRADGGSETLLLSMSIKSGVGTGIYADGGDSRALDCTLITSASASDASGNWTAVAELSRKDTETLVVNPSKLNGKVDAVVIRITKDLRMAKSYNKLWNAILQSADTTDGQVALDSTIGLKAHSQDGILYVWLEGDADDRGESTYQVRIEYALTSKKVTLWSDLEFVDHP